MKKHILTLSALALSLSISQTTLACNDHMQHFSGEHLAKIAEKLHLSTEQRTKIKLIRHNTVDAMAPKFAELQTLHLKTNDLLDKDTLDEKALDTIISQEKETLGDMLKLRIIEKHDIIVLLTPSQKTAFFKMLEKNEHKEHMTK